MQPGQVTRISGDNRRHIHIRARKDIDPLVSCANLERIAPQISNHACGWEDERRIPAARPSLDHILLVRRWVIDIGHDVRAARHGAAHTLVKVKTQPNQRTDDHKTY